MKKLFNVVTALAISFSMNAQLTAVTEGSNTGQRLSISNASNHGNIGENAVDLSYQPYSSSTKGATGSYAVAVGQATTASGSYSTALGSGTTASGGYSTAMGYYTNVSGGYSTAMGYGSAASGNYSTAMGIFTSASGNYSTAMGNYAAASGDNSTAIGRYTTASDYGSLVIGQYNSSGSSATSASSFSTSAPAFVIGSGTNGSNRSDAFKVMFNGNTSISGDDLTIGDLSAFSGSFTQRSAIDVVAHSDGDLLTAYASGSSGDRFNIELDTGNSLAKISSGGGYNLTLSSEGGTMNFEGGGMGTTTYAFDGDVVVSSDARLKSNIVSLGSTLAKILQIDGKSYTMKKDESEKQKIGLLAQDIEKVFPILVSESNGIKSVNYQGLVPVLINALKEQDAMMKEQDNRISNQQSEIDKLKNILKKLIEKP